MQSDARPAEIPNPPDLTCQRLPRFRNPERDAGPVAQSLSVSGWGEKRSECCDCWLIEQSEHGITVGRFTVVILGQHCRCRKVFMNLAHKTKALVILLWREVLKFGTVGGLGWVIDNGIYTLLWYGPMSDSTIKARIVSTAVATLFAWFANRYWTFRHRRSERVWKEFGLFLLMNGLGLGIVLACQVISRYVLGFTSFTADFIAGGVIGLILGTIFRFLAYRYFVFNEELSAEFEPITETLTKPNAIATTRTR